MHTARANLNITAHNMANYAIPGFSRQVSVQSANPALSLRNGRGMYGMGSSVNNVIQMRDQFIDRRFWGQQATLGEFAVKVPQLSLIEAVFNDLSTGTRAAFNDFFSRMQELSRDSHDPTFRLNVVRTGETLTQMIRNNAEALQNQQRDLNGEVRAVVTEVNSLGQQIASLNEQIRGFEFDGSNANDLRDQRALLIDRLSELVNVDVHEHDFSATSGLPNDKRLTVSINGYDFVNGDTVHRLELTPRNTYPDWRPSRNEMDVVGLYDIQFENGSPFNIYSRTLRGTLKGLIDVRDGNGGQITHVWDQSVNDDTGAFVPGHPTTSYKGIPFYMNRLNEMIRIFAQAINEGVDAQGNAIPGTHGGHHSGFGLDGQSGRDFFSWTRLGPGGQELPVLGTGSNLHYLNALNFNINQDLLANPQWLGAASDPTQGESANDIVLGFIAVGNFPSLFREGRLEDFLIATSGHLGIDIQQAQRFRRNYHEMTIATQNQRLSISGVDMNEELLNMTRFNQMWQNNARMIATMNDVYDTLINRLGI